MEKDCPLPLWSDHETAAPRWILRRANSRERSGKLAWKANRTKKVVPRLEQWEVDSAMTLEVDDYVPREIPGSPGDEDSELIGLRDFMVKVMWRSREFNRQHQALWSAKSTRPKDTSTVDMEFFELLGKSESDSTRMMRQNELNPYLRSALYLLGSLCVETAGNLIVISIFLVELRRLVSSWFLSFLSDYRCGLVGVVSALYFWILLYWNHQNPNKQSCLFAGFLSQRSCCHCPIAKLEIPRGVLKSIRWGLPVMPGFQYQVISILIGSSFNLTRFCLVAIQSSQHSTSFRFRDLQNTFAVGFYFSRTWAVSLECFFCILVTFIRAYTDSCDALCSLGFLPDGAKDRLCHSALDSRSGSTHCERLLSPFFLRMKQDKFCCCT